MIGYEIVRKYGMDLISIEEESGRYVLHLPSWINAKPGQFLVLMDAEEWRELSREDDPPLVQAATDWEQIEATAKARVLKRFPSAGIRGDGTDFWIEDNHGPIMGYRTSEKPRAWPDEQTAWIETDKATRNMPDAVLKTSKPITRDWEAARAAVLAIYPHATCSCGFENHYIISGNPAFNLFDIEGPCRKSCREAWLDAAERLKTQDIFPSTVSITEVDWHGIHKVSQ